MMHDDEWEYRAAVLEERYEARRRATDARLAQQAQATDERPSPVSTQGETR